MLIKRPLIIIAGLVLFFIDQYFKKQVLGEWSAPHLYFCNSFGWEQFKNSGIAFGLPMPISIAIVFSVLIIFVLIYYFLRVSRAGLLGLALGFWLIIIGAVSNMIDRVVYGVTIDYIRILTGVFNLADGCILVGVIILFLASRKKVGAIHELTLQ